MSRIFLILFFISSFCCVGCYRWRHSRGGGENVTTTGRTVNPLHVALPPGYEIEAVSSGLTFPSAVAFDESNNLYAIETGYSYGEVWGQPKLLRIDANGKTYAVATGPKNGPWTGITWHNGAFYIAEGGEEEGGRILKVTKDGTITPLIANLPSVGDHHTNGPVIKDGYIYFGQGTATNSGVVGVDNAEYGWLARKPLFHDIPCGDITLTGKNYTSPNPLTNDANDTATTGAFVPFGTSTSAGQVIKGVLPCTGSVMRIPINGGGLELVAWGFRNPFGLAFSPDNRLFVTENGYDDRGSRRVWGTGDVLWEVKTGMWYGWPDFSAGKPISNDEEFKPPTSKSYVAPLLRNNPSTAQKPAAIFGVHSSSNGLDFSRSSSFGFNGEAFVAQFGDLAPTAGKVLSPVGFKVVRVNTETGVVRDFAVNRGKRNGPASFLRTGGLERPLSVKFDNTGNALYLVDFGVMTVTDQGPMPQAGTGIIWKITRK